MGWTREKQTKEGIIVSFGPFVTPRRTRAIKNIIWLLFIAVFVISFAFLTEVFLDKYRAYRFFNAVPFIKGEWVIWMVKNPLQVFFGSLGTLFILRRLIVIADRIAFLVLPKFKKVIFTPEKVKVRQGLLMKSCNRKQYITFEATRHPKAKWKSETYKKAKIVIMRCGAGKPAKIAHIQDWTAFHFGHKSEQLVEILQETLNRPQKQKKKPKQDKKPEKDTTHFFDDREI